jgi:hypothetical protein
MTEPCCDVWEAEDPHECCECLDVRYVLDAGCRCLSCVNTPCPECNPEGQLLWRSDTP